MAGPNKWNILCKCPVAPDDDQYIIPISDDESDIESEGEGWEDAPSEIFNNEWEETASEESSDHGMSQAIDDESDISENSYETPNIPEKWMISE
jgi:hypothetical protein